MEREEPGFDAFITADTTTMSGSRVERDDTNMVQGYVFGTPIGAGGIGEVIAAHDLRVGRDVAIKRLKTKTPTADEVSRFMREARIQARLEHPGIPPVHEIGTDAANRPYFAMQKLAGITLHQHLAAPEQNRPKLLRAFVEACRAIEFAHSRGIVHRDLKPANIMLGEFGDVYVIDWGLARVVGEAVTELVSDDIDSLDVKTGDLIGTPGYMAPEQVQRIGDTGQPADVYALGAILFEILVGEPVHPRGASAIASTVSGSTILSPAKRRPDRAVPPELDAVTASMLAMDPTTRPSARRVAERIEAYLDGDRDVARRRTMAVDLVWVARNAMNEGRRAEAMRSAGRALALDPESTGAAEIVTTLMLEPPEAPPAELAETLRANENDAIRRHARTSIVAFLAIAGFLPLAIWNGVRHWEPVIATHITAWLMAAAAITIMRRPARSLPWMIGYALGNVVLMGLLTRMAGPFTFVPALTCVVITSVSAYPQFIGRTWLLIAMAAGGFLLGIGLESAGVLARTWEIQGGMFISHAGALELAGTPTLTLLILASVATFVVAGIHAGRIHKAGRDAQRQLATQAWHLRQLLPKT